MFKGTLILLILLTHLYASEFIFPYWKSMNKLNKELLESDDHKAYIDIYVNDLAKEPYIRETERFPVGAIIIKPLYPKDKRENIARIVIMMKMQKGYDSKNGDWWYGSYNENGIDAYAEGKINSCIMCHEVAQDTDYLFSESVMYDIKSQIILKDGTSSVLTSF